FRISRSNTKPCLSGKRKSMTTASKPDSASKRSAVWASGACSGTKPLCASARSSQAAISRSSSTSRTRMAFVFRRRQGSLILHALAQIAGFLPSFEQDCSQFIQGLRVDFALELDDRVQRHPVLAPAPGVEFRTMAGAQADVRVAPDHPQQKPDLF